MFSFRLRVAAVCGLAGLLLGVPCLGGALAQARGSARARVDGQCANADASVAWAPAALLRSAVACLINQQREARGLPPLRASARLNEVAQRHTQAMVVSQIFSHGADFAMRFTRGGYDWRAAGENIATGYSTPRSVVAAWMASLEHCQNILDPTFRDVGTGVSAGAAGANMGPGTWTQDFGLLMSQSTPSRNPRPEDGCPYP